MEISDLLREASKQLEAEIKEVYKTPGQLEFAQSLIQSVKIYFNSSRHLKGTLQEILCNPSSLPPTKVV